MEQTVTRASESDRPQSAPSGRRYAGAEPEVRRADRLARLEEAGLDLFSADGYRQTTVSAVCELARVSRRHFYEQFEDREALLLHLYKRVQADTRTAVLGAITEYTGSRGESGFNRTELVEIGITAYIKVLLRDPRALRVAFVEVVGVSPELEAYRMGNRREWALLLQGAALTAGVVPVQPWVYTAFIPSVNEFLLAWWQTTDDHSDPSELVSVLATVLMAVVQEPSARGNDSGIVAT